MASTPSARTSWSWMVLMMLFGGALYTRPGAGEAGPASAHHPAPTKAGEIPELALTGIDRRHRLDEPLRKHLDVLSPSGDDNFPIAQLAGHEISYLIVTVADPIDSDDNYRFDLQLDTLHRALATDNDDPWVVSNFYSPWQIFRDRRQAKYEVTLHDEEHLYRQEPGVLVFGKAHLDDKPRIAESRFATHQILVVLLVGEQPTLGIQRPAFKLAVDQIRVWEAARHAHARQTDRKKSQPLVISVAGPTFSGSAASLASTIRECVEQSRLQHAELHFEVITGEAVGIDPQWFRKTAENTKFGATIRHQRVATHALANHLAARQPWNPGKKLRIAWLVESSTALGASVRGPKTGARDRAPASPWNHAHSTHKVAESAYFYYPLHISQVRNQYERRRHQEDLHPPAIAPLPGATSPLPFEASDDTRDLPDMMTPSMTGPAVELQLAQTLNTIDRDGYQYVGISATDVRDPIFLADQIREHCPQVQILILGPALLHTHPQYRASLSGAILASTYPMLADAQRWCYPFQYGAGGAPPPGESHGPVRPAFSNPDDSCAGLYNAIILLRALDRGRPDSGKSSPPQKGTARWKSDSPATIDVAGFLPLWCYGPPHQSCELSQPAVWISGLGADGAWPTDAAGGDDDLLLGAPYTIKLRQNEHDHATVSAPPIRFTSPYLPFLTLASVATVIFLLRSLRTIAPLKPADWPPWGLNKRPFPLREWCGMLFTTIGALVLLNCTSGTSFVFLRATDAFSGSIEGMLHVLHYGIAFGGFVVSICSAVTYCRVTRRRLPCWSTLLFLSLAVACCYWWWAAPEKHLAFQTLTLAAILNGVSPVLSTALSAAAIAVLGYTMLHQHFLIRTAQQEWPECLQATFDIQHLLTPWPRWRIPPIVAIVMLAVILAWLAIAVATVYVGVDSVRTRLLFVTLSASSLLWWWMFLEGLHIGKRLREALHDSHEIWLGPDRAKWKSIFQELNRDESRSIGRFVFALRPRKTDRVGQKIARQLFFSPEMQALDIYRVAQIGGKQLCLTVYALATAAILILLAAVGFPFNTGPSIRFMMAAMFLAAGGGFLGLYVRLDRDPLLSRMVGTRPHAINWSWTLVHNAGLVIGAVGIAVVAQRFPGVWTWLWSTIQGAVGVTG